MNVTRLATSKEGGGAYKERGDKSLIMKVNEDRGAYVGSLGQEVYLMLYSKRTMDELRASLPLSFDPTRCDANYVIACFNEAGADHLGQTSFATVEKQIIDGDMRSVFHEYAALKEWFPALGIDRHRNWVAFAQQQLEL